MIKKYTLAHEQDFPILMENNAI